MENKTSKGSGRKIIAVAVLYIVGIFFLIVNRTSFTDGADYATWLYLLYAVGNVGTKVTKVIKDGEVLDFGLSRKLTGFIILGLTASGLMFLKSGGEYVVVFKDGAKFIQNIFFIYIGGNVGDKVANITNKLMPIKKEKIAE